MAEASRENHPAAPPSPGRRMVLRALILVGLLCVPVVGLTLLQAGVFLACSTQTTAEGVMAGRIAWRITRMECRNGREAFYDVAVGAEGKTLATALTSRGKPTPLDVLRLDEGLIGVRLDASSDGSTAAVIKIPLRRSGSPKERIDLQSGAWRAAAS